MTTTRALRDFITLEPRITNSRLAMNISAAAASTVIRKTPIEASEFIRSLAANQRSLPQPRLTGGALSSVELSE
jgi:hypothetical protein